MQYKDSHVVCTAYGTDKMPKACMNIVETGVWDGVSSSCLAAYRHRDNIEHLLWANEHGYLSEFDIIEDIKNGCYRQINFFYRVFVLPFLKKIKGTVAADDDDWFDKWHLNDYLKNMPSEHQVKIAELARKTCFYIYKEKKIPTHIESVLLEIGTLPLKKWIFKLRHALWG